MAKRQTALQLFVIGIAICLLVCCTACGSGGGGLSKLDGTYVDTSPFYNENTESLRQTITFDGNNISFNAFGHWNAKGTYEIKNGNIVIDFTTWDGEKYTIDTPITRKGDTITILYATYAKQK